MATAFEANSRRLACDNCFCACCSRHVCGLAQRYRGRGGWCSGNRASGSDIGRDALDVSLIVILFAILMIYFVFDCFMESMTMVRLT
jgi:hypothetical protein